MARRPDPADFARPLSPEQLAEKRRRLSLLSPQHVADADKKAHDDCKMIGDRPPRAAAVQELVTA